MQEARNHPAATERIIQAGFALAFICLGVIGVISFTSLTRLSKAADDTRHSQDVITALGLLLSTTTDAETAQRGFVITGNESFLQPYKDAYQKADTDLGYLRKLTAHNVAQGRQLEILAPLVAERINEITKLIELRRSQGFAAAQAEIASGRGKMLQDRIRAITADMETAEQSLMRNDELSTQRAVTLTRLVILSGSAVAFFVVAFSLVLVRRDFAMRQRAEAELDRFFTLSLDFLCIASADGYFKRASPAVTDILGWSVEEFLARPFISFVHPDDVDATQREVDKQIVAGEKVLRFDNRYRHKDGTWRVLSWRSVPQLGGLMYATARDTTELKRMEESLREANELLEQRVQQRTADLLKTSSDLKIEITEHQRTEAALRESEELFSKAFRLSPDCVAIVRLSDRSVIRANEALCRLWGSTPEEVIGKPTREYSSWVNEEEQLDFMQNLEQKGECLDCQTKLRLADGRLLDFNVSSRQISFNGEACVLSVMRDITARKQNEVAAALLGAIVQSSDDAIVGKNLKGIVTSWNAGAEKLFGYLAPEMVGQSIRRLIPPERQHEEAEILARVRNGESIRHFETVRLCKDGRKIDVSVTVSAIKDDTGKIIGASKVARDITERKRTALALAESQALYHSLVEQMPAGVFRKDAAGRYVFVNSYFARIRNETPEQFLGQLPQELPPAERPFVEEATRHHAQIMKTGRPIEVLDEYRRNDGQTLFFHVVKSPVLDSDGKITGSQGVLLDVTTEKRAEGEVRRLNAELEQRVIERTAQLEAANKELEAFSYSVSHDLRAPLRAVNGFAGIVLEEFGPQLNGEGRRYLERIRNGGRQMGVLIDDLLAFSRLGRQSMSTQSIDAAQLVQAALGELAPQLERPQIVINTGQLPICRGDPVLVKQVWINLLSNAIKYTRDRAPAIIEIGCERKQDEHIYFVRDNGAGFDMQYAHKLFGVFQRLHRSDEFEGTGVGLAIVQRIVHRHGGRVWAEAELDRGATFYFTLPGENQL